MYCADPVDDAHAIQGPQIFDEHFGSDNKTKKNEEEKEDEEPEKVIYPSTAPAALSPSTVPYVSESLGIQQ